jgi:NAD(P)-dependent dehydrogenase (short-subunit alcohol dehydrogenase family)
MRFRQKRVANQVMVITGASSGIGLATAREAARRGARVMLVSRDEEDLRRAVLSISGDGGHASYMVADVADLDAMMNVAEWTIREFGGFDTWLNNAGVSIYGELEEVALEDARRLFETNYWGVVNGCLAALPHLRSRGGTLINVGSVLSDTAMPLQGHYAASKQAVKGFTDSLRIELEHDNAPVIVTLVQPTSIDTPYPVHARNYLEVEPKVPAPIYSPEVVARTILHCAENPERNVKVGGGAKMFTMIETLAPSVGDRMKQGMFDQQRTDRPARHRDTLHSPRPGDGRIYGNNDGRTRQRSLFTTMSLHPMATLAGFAALGAGVAYGLGNRE